MARIFITQLSFKRRRYRPSRITSDPRLLQEVGDLTPIGECQFITFIKQSAIRFAAPGVPILNKPLLAITCNPSG